MKTAYWTKKYENFDSLLKFIVLQRGKEIEYSLEYYPSKLPIVTKVVLAGRKYK